MYIIRHAKNELKNDPRCEYNWSLIVFFFTFLGEFHLHGIRLIIDGLVHGMELERARFSATLFHRNSCRDNPNIVIH
jgi:chorismate synthase